MKPLKIVNASAGSGKTYTLVQEYLRIILHDKNVYKYKSIIAMTFTNKAANEMKNRILEALVNLSKPEHQKTEEQLKYLIDTSKNLEIAPRILEERSAKILNAILHHYSAFSVMTIDKFTHRIIRTFAKDLNISVDFDVELDTETLRKNVTDLLFDQIGRDEELTRLMLHYAKSNLSEDKSWDFSKQLFEFSRRLFEESAINAIEQLPNLSGDDFLKIQENLQKENIIVTQKLIRQAEEALAIANEKNLSDEDFQGKSNGILSYFRKIKNNRFEPASNTLTGYVNSGKWGHEKSSKKIDADQIGYLLEKYFHQIHEILEGPYKNVILNQEILGNLNNLSLLNHLLVLIENIKQEQNILLISDFYKKISAIITEEKVPFIYERMGVRYEHFLLDEFQDTSHLQWINMIPLVHNSLASGKSNLIVGDGKQAIYRWRNGEVEQFTGLPDRIYNPSKIASLQEAEVLFSAMGESVHLKENYRSAPEIVNFNNDCFDYLSRKLPLSVAHIYKNANQSSTKKSEGYIEARLEKEMTDPIQLDYILEIINRSKEKGFNYGDICILTRKNDKTILIADFLTRKGIKVISPESLHIGKDLSVKFLFSFICSTAIPSDINHKIKSLEHFCVLKQNKQPEEMIANLKEKLPEISIEKIFFNLGYNLSKPASFSNLYSYVVHLVDVFKLDLANNTFLQFFLEQVHLFEKKQSSSIRDFIDWFMLKGATKSIVSPEGEDAVQVMTIFKAKGLEFPIVICPFFDWKLELHRQIAWVENHEGDLPAFFVKIKQQLKSTHLESVYTEEESKFLLDNLNLVYVAFTRASNALFICGDAKKSNTPTSLWLNEYFSQNEKMERKGEIYFTGNFTLPNRKHKQKKENYYPEFSQKKLVAPAISFKSSETWSIDELDEKRGFGTKLHYVLSKLKSHNDLSLQLHSSKQKGIVQEMDIEPMFQIIEDLFNDIQFTRYFGKEKSLNEKEIITKKGQKLIPDKLIFFPDHLLVVDFKTGAKTNRHVEQIVNYISVLKEMGFEKVKGELYYTESKEVIKV